MNFLSLLFLFGLLWKDSLALDFIPVREDLIRQVAEITENKPIPHMIASVADPSCLSAPNGSGAESVRFLGAVEDSERAAVEKSMHNLRYFMGRNSSVLAEIGFRFVDELPLRRDGGCLPGHQYADGGRTLTFARRCPIESRQRARRLPADHATLIHEIGHFVGNRGSFYSAYYAMVPSVCKVSRYCTHSSAGRAHQNRNEEFAEVFAAYLVAPRRLEKACPDAFEFMKERIFVGAKVSCSRRPTSAIKSEVNHESCVL